MISSETIDGETLDKDAYVKEMSDQIIDEPMGAEGFLDANGDEELEDGEIEEADALAETLGHITSNTDMSREPKTKARDFAEKTSSSSTLSSDEDEGKKKKRKKHKRKKRRDREKEPKKLKKRRLHDDVDAVQAGRQLHSSVAAESRPLESPSADRSPPGPYDSPPGPYDSPYGSPQQQSFQHSPSPSAYISEGDEDQDVDEDDGKAASASRTTLLSLIGDSHIDPTVAAHESQDIFSRRAQLSPSVAKQRKLAKRKKYVNHLLKTKGQMSSSGAVKGKVERPKCKFFMEGKCTKGDDCTFSHNFVPPRKRDACKFFLQGYCAKGDACVYLHNEIPCRYFHTGQKCYHGENCRFSHDPLTEDMRPVLQKAVESAVEEAPEPKKRPSLLGSPPAHIKEAAERMLEQQQKAIPSLFDIRVEPTAELACRLGERSGTHHDGSSPPGTRSQLSPGTQQSRDRLAPDVADTGPAGHLHSKPKPSGFYAETMLSPPHPQMQQRPRAALLPTPVMHADEPPSDESDSNDEATASTQPSQPFPVVDTANACVAEQPVALPPHLPKAQRELLLRLQKQQSQRVPDQSDVLQPVPEEDNWYSSDEEVVPTKAVTSGSYLSSASLPAAVPSSNILTDILNSISLPQRQPLVSAALAAPTASTSQQSSSITQMLLASIRASQPASNPSISAAAVSDSTQGLSALLSNVRGGPAVDSALSMGNSFLASSLGSSLSSLSGAGSLLSMSGATLGLPASSQSTPGEYRLIPITVDKHQPWLPPGARTDPELQKDPRIQRMLKRLAEVHESPMSPPSEDSREPHATTTTQSVASYATLPDIVLPPISKNLMEQLQGLNVAALTAKLPVVDARLLQGVAAAGLLDSSRTKENPGVVLTDPRLAPDTRLLQLPADPRQKPVDPRVKPSDPRSVKPADTVQPRTLLADPRVPASLPVGSRTLLGNDPRVAVAEQRTPLLADPMVFPEQRMLVGLDVPASDLRSFGGEVHRPSMSEQRMSIAHDPRSAYSNGFAGRGLRPPPMGGAFFDQGKSRRGGHGMVRPPRLQGVLPKPPPGVGLLPTPGTPPLQDSRSTEKVAVEPETLAAALPAEPVPEPEPNKLPSVQQRGEGDSRKIGLRKSSMEYSSPLGGDGDTDKSEPSFNSYNKPRNVSRTNATRVATTASISVADRSSPSNGGSGHSSDVHRLIGDSLIAYDRPPVEQQSLKEMFKTFDPTASPFS